MEITCKHVICMLADCSMDTSHLRKNIFTHKQAPSSPIHHFSFPPAWTIVTGSIARGQKALTFFPPLSFVCLLFSPPCSPSRALPHHFISLSPLSSLFTPQCCLHYSSSPLLSSFVFSLLSSLLQLRSEELAAAQCDVDSKASCGVQLSQKTWFDLLPLLSEQLSSRNGRALRVLEHVCVSFCMSHFGARLL